MARIAIVGDGPAGLSSALFLAKNGHHVTVFGPDQTPMHFAQLYNYLGIDDLPGPEFQKRARVQVTKHGATIVEAQVTGIESHGELFTLEISDGSEVAAEYVILAAGKAGQSLAHVLGVEIDGDGVSVDADYRTAVDRVYAVGRLARPNRSQAIISAGAGAIAALDVLSREAEDDVTDWDRVDI